MYDYFIKLFAVKFFNVFQVSLNKLTSFNGLLMTQICQFRVDSPLFEMILVDTYLLCIILSIPMLYQEDVPFLRWFSRSATAHISTFYL